MDERLLDAGAVTPIDPVEAERFVLRGNSPVADQALAERVRRGAREGELEVPRIQRVSGDLRKRLESVAEIGARMDNVASCTDTCRSN